MTSGPISLKYWFTAALQQAGFIALTALGRLPVGSHGGDTGVELNNVSHRTQSISAVTEVSTVHMEMIALVM